MERKAKKQSRFVVIIDELADLMLSEERKEVEKNIVRIAQLGRAAGVHLIIATQRPTTNIITGTIKANIPCRVAFALPSVTDSRTVLDHAGAETLRGNGDGLCIRGGDRVPVSFQAAFLENSELDRFCVVRSRFEIENGVRKEPITQKCDFDMSKIKPTFWQSFCHAFNMACIDPKNI